MIRPAPPSILAVSSVTKGMYGSVSSLPYCMVNVQGVSPTAGKTFGHQLSTGQIVEVLSAAEAVVPPGNTVDKISRTITDGAPSGSLTMGVGAIVAGGFFSYQNNLYRKVMVEGHEPEEGSSWVLKMISSTGGLCDTVVPMEDVTSVESQPGKLSEVLLKI